MELYHRIKERREYLGLSQKELANKLGYKSRSTINKIELGINDISQSKVYEFAKALETTPQYLMGWTDNPNEESKSDNVELDENVIMYHRDGKTVMKKMSKEQMKMLSSMIDAIPDEEHDF